MSVSQALLKCVGKASSTASTFTLQASPENVDFRAGAYGNGVYTMSGTGGNYTTGPGYNNIVYSTDRINWTAVPSPSLDFSNMRGGVFGLGTFAFVSLQANSASKIMISTNGTTWTIPTTGATVSHGFSDITFGNNVFVAIGYDNSSQAASVLRSIDGTTWGSTDIPSGRWSAITFGAGKFVAVRDGTADTQCVLMSNDNGLTWNKYTAHPYLWEQVAFGAGKFVAISNNSAVCMTSTNGTTWTLQPAINLNSGTTDLKFINGQFILTTQNGSGIHTSADGITWQALASPVISSTVVYTDNTNVIYGVVNPSEPLKCIMTSP